MKRLVCVLVCLVSSGVLWSAPVKNVIWVIGDGMGPEILGFWMQGAHYAQLKKVPLSHTEKLINHSTMGLYFNNTYDTIVTDSAASATQMATGQLSRPLFIGMDYRKKSVPNLLEMAREHGKAVGVVTDAYVTDATPAGFTAHVEARQQHNEIAAQQIKFGPEVILGGGLKYFNRDENKDLLQVAQQKGYQIVQDKEQLAQVKKGKVLGLFADKGMPLAVEMHDYPTLPSLTDMARSAITLLEQDKDGFVLMVEAGKIDWAAHANDPGAVWAEMKAFDALIGFLVEYVDKHPQTLLYINADHDTGLGAFTYRHVGKEKAKQLAAQGEMLYGGDTDYASFKAYEAFDKQQRSLDSTFKLLKKVPPEKRTKKLLQQSLSGALGYPVDMDQFADWTDLEGVFKQLNSRWGMSYATRSHSAAPLLSIAYGTGAQAFGGVYHNTEILPRLRTVLEW